MTISLKTGVIACGLLFGLVATQTASASCQNICVRAYNDCMRYVIDPAVCQAELDQCLADCSGGGDFFADRRLLKETDAQQCQRSEVPKRELVLVAG